MKKKKKQELTDGGNVVYKNTTVFDENGHRIKRNPETMHRAHIKCTQINPNLYDFAIKLPIVDLAKLRIYVKGKTAPATTYKNRKSRRAFRPLTPADLVREFVHALVKDVKLDSESLKWVDETTKKRTEMRQKQDAMIAAGVNRIPRDQQLARGYPSKKTEENG